MFLLLFACALILVLWEHPRYQKVMLMCWCLCWRQQTRFKTEVWLDITCSIWIKNSLKVVYSEMLSGIQQWSVSIIHSIVSILFNPLMPVPPATARDEPWPFFLFRCHHFWPKLASSILNFCSRKRSFQWCPDHSDRPNGALDMHKNAQNVEWKTQGKISCHYTWLLHAKIARLDDAFSEVF